MSSKYPKKVEVSERLRLLSFRPNIPEIPDEVANVKEIFRNFIVELKVEIEVNMYGKWKNLRSWNPTKVKSTEESREVLPRFQRWCLSDYLYCSGQKRP